MRMQILGAALEDGGIPHHLPDTETKVLDPFLTGANAFACRLMVPADRVEDAARLLEEMRREATGALAEEEEPERSPAERREDALRDLGRRVLWAALFGITHPFAFYYGWYYLRNTWRKPKPRGYVLTLVALGAVVLVWTLVAVLFVQLALL